VGGGEGLSCRPLIQYGTVSVFHEYNNIYFFFYSVT